LLLGQVLDGASGPYLKQKISNRYMKLWTIWKYALGGFSDDKTEPYDNYVALLRTIIVGVNFATCFFIMANVVHNW